MTDILPLIENRIKTVALKDSARCPRDLPNLSYQ